MSPTSPSSYDAQIAKIDVVVQKLDDAITRIAEVSQTMRETLVLHDEKLDQQNTINVKLYDEIAAIQLDLQQAREEIMKSQNAALKDLDRRVGSLEKWKWIILGAAAAVSTGWYDVVGRLRDFFAGG